MPAYKVEIQEVIERSGIVSAASKDEVEAALEEIGYALAIENDRSAPSARWYRSWR